MNTSESQGNDIPVHEERKFLAEVEGEEFFAFDTLEEAALDPDAAVVLSGDYGGSIFLTVPVKHVRCGLEALRTLVADLDAITYLSGDPTVATVAVERHPVGAGVAGGDGGGVVIDGVWTHPERLPPEVRHQAAQVVLGERQRIDLDLLRRERARAVAEQKAWREAGDIPSEHRWEGHIRPPVVPFD